MSQDQGKNNDIEQILNEVDELRKELQGGQEGKAANTTAAAQEMKTILDEARTAAQLAAVAEAARQVAEVVAASAPPAAVTAPAPTASAPVVAEVPAPIVAAAALVAAPEAAPAAAVDESFVPSAEDTAAVDPNSGLLDTDDLMKEFHQCIESDGQPAAEGGMESNLAELKEDTTVKTLLDETFDDQERRMSQRQIEEPMSQKASEKNFSDIRPSEFGRSNSGTEPTMTMSLTGSMSLKLKYEFGGQEVTVGFTDDFLKIELADGTEFKIPVGRQKTLRRVA